LVIKPISMIANLKRRRRKTLPCHQAARQAHWSGNWTSGLPSAPILVVKLLDKLIGREIGQVACRQHTSLSSSCSTSSLVWKLDKWLTVSTLPCHQAARQAHWSGNWTSSLPSTTTKKREETLVNKLLDKLIGLEIGQVACRQQQRRKSEKKPLSSSCSTSSLVWKLDKWLAVGTPPCHQAAQQAH
jgi:hypothetical protein